METIFLIDTSKSMEGERVGQLNHVMLEILTRLENFSENTKENVYVRVVNFDNVARFFIGRATQSIRVDKAYDMWHNLIAKGATDTAHAVRLCKKSRESDYATMKYDKTVAIVVTDGKSSDEEDFNDAISEMKESLSKMKEKSIFFASIGVFDYDGKELEAFADLNNVCKTKYSKRNSESVYRADDIYKLNDIMKKILED